MARVKPDLSSQSSSSGSTKPLSANAIKELKSTGPKLRRKCKTSTNGRNGQGTVKYRRATDGDEDQNNDADALHVEYGEEIKELERNDEEEEELDRTDAESVDNVKKALLKTVGNSTLVPIKAPVPSVPNNGRHVGRQLIRWSRKCMLFYPASMIVFAHILRDATLPFAFICFPTPYSFISAASYR
jgi:hypothetical protein